jgi:Ca2+-binding RTX toxin-like protein
MQSTTVRRGAGISNSAFNAASNDVNDGLKALVAFESEVDRFLTYRSHGHDHDNYWRVFTWARPADRDWEAAHHKATDNGDTVDAGDGNDIVYGQEGRDVLNGGLGNDWLIGGAGEWNNRDVLTGGGGTDKLYQGENSTTALRDAVKAMLPTWSGAFASVGLPIDPFSANSQPVSGHPDLADFDYLQFIASPWPVQAGTTVASSSVASATSTAGGWLDDFLNHAGQTEAARNPNAALTVKVNVAASSKADADVSVAL